MKQARLVEADQGGVAHTFQSPIKAEEILTEKGKRLVFTVVLTITPVSGR